MAARLRALSFIFTCLITLGEPHFSISQMHFSHQVGYGLQQAWWQPQVCEFNIQCEPLARYRTADGSCNNLQHPEWGRADWPYDRLLPPVYEDGHWYPRSRASNGHLLPGPRTISTHIHQPDPEVSTRVDTITNLFNVWGQYLDHDITFTPQMTKNYGETVECCDDMEKMLGAKQYEGGPCFNIDIPMFDRALTRRCMKFTRSTTASPEKQCGISYKEQVNAATAFIDGSQIYGSSAQTESARREHNGGLLKTTFGSMMPEDTGPSCIKVDPADFCFVAGDPRSNEHPGLSVLHTLFLREHNRIAEALSDRNPLWDDERLFQETKKIIAAMQQIITYREFLPMLLGPEVMHVFELGLDVPYSYRPDTNPTAFNSFATAAFRYGHSQIPNVWTVGADRVSLGSMFMRPFFLLKDDHHGYEQVLQGMTHDCSKKVDLLIGSGVSDQLFEHGDMPALDLISLNIQRGRDHGLPPYKQFQNKCSAILGKKATWSPQSLWKILQTYRSLHDVDLFTGGLAENHLTGAQIGPTFACIIGLFFHRIKWGDRFWHQTTDTDIGFTLEQQTELSKMTLARVMCDNSVVTEIPIDVFMKESASNPAIDCTLIPRMDLDQWIE